MELILNTYGTSLKREDDCFLIETKNGKQKVATLGIDSILLCKGIFMTTDAMMLAVKNEIPILLLEDSGKVCARLWSPKYGSISTIRKSQLAFCFSPNAIKWVKELIVKKMQSQQALLLLIANHHTKDEIKATAKAVSRIGAYTEKIEKLNSQTLAETISTLRGWEGNAANIYFKEINNYLPEYLRFEERSQHPAFDVFNAFLNFGYGILYSKVETVLIKAGIDPYIGIMHRDDYNRPALVFDVIEPYRIWVDYVVVNLASQIELTTDYYSVDKDGGYWLESLGRKVLIQSLNDYLEEPATIEGKNKTRLTHIQDNAYKLAKLFETTRLTDI